MEAVTRPDRQSDGERLLRALLDRLPALISYWDRDVRNVLANDAFHEWFGLTPEQMHGMPLREIIGEQGFAMKGQCVEGVLAGEEQVFDGAIVDRHGRTRQVQVSYSPDIVHGEVRGFFALIIDVTARVNAQRAMDEAQNLASVGSWEWDVQTGKIAWSDELYRIFGLEKGAFEPTLESLTRYVHPEDASRMKAARDRAMEAGEAYTSDYRICRPDGGVREVHTRGRPVTDDSGEVVRITGTLQDVTEVNQTARELAHMNAELLQLNELNADVIGMLGHDVRGPLTVVLGYLEELDEAWETTAEGLKRAHVSVARAAAGQLRTLVDDILALASVESGTIVPETSGHDLVVMVFEALGEVAGHSDVAVVGDRNLKAWCDAFHVRQIVANLVSNALRYGAPPVVVSLESADDTVDVTVSDGGLGVPEEFVPHLFDRFTRGPGQRSTRGTGLGLYIAGRLAEANHGTLRYRAGPEGRGAVFTLTLPRDD